MKKLTKGSPKRRASLVQAYVFEGTDWEKWYDVDERWKGGCWIRKYRCVVDPWDWSDQCKLTETKEVKIC